MLSGNIHAKDALAGDGVLARVLRFLKDNSADLRDGRHDLEDGVFVVVKEYKPGDAASKRFETHVKYADVQYVAAGGENILVAPADGLAVTEDRLEADDIRFHAEPEASAVVTHAVGEGDYLLLLPADAHKPECDRGMDFCRKCIAKIPVGLLE